jgi:hypothetical protein
MNHWGAWQVAEEAITLHIEPLTETVAHALTIGFLHAAMIAEGFDPSEAVVWYDTTDLRTRPDKSGNAIEAYDRNELSGDALLRELGLSVEDAPDEQEKRERILLGMARGVPVLAPEILGELGYLSAESVEIMEAIEIEATEPEALPEPDTERSMPERATVHTPLAAACDIIVRRALERAGSRLRSAAGKGQVGGAASVECDDPTTFHTQIDATTYSNFDTLLDGAWSLVPEVAERYNTDPEDLIATLDTYTRALLASKQEHRYGRLALAIGLPR